jgi:hypothetical protein
MKKLLVVFTAILVVAFAAPAFATDATWSGELDFGGITAFDKADFDSAWVNGYTDLTLDVDDYTDIVLEFGWGDGATLADWAVWYAGVDTDLGMALGLPVGLIMSGGYINIWSNKYEVTGHATERDKIRSNIGTSPMFVAAVDVGMATIKAGVGFETGPMAQDYAVYVDAPGIADMVDLEVGYFISDNDDFKGQFMVSAKATDIMGMIGVAGGFKYDATDEDGPDGIPGNADDPIAWFWGLGVKADLMDMIGLGVSVAGQKDEAFRNLNVDANVAITDEFGIDVGLGLGFGDVLDTFGGLEPSVYYTAGAATWRLGYLYQASDVNNYMYAAPMAAPVDGSGLFLNVGLDF